MRRYHADQYAVLDWDNTIRKGFTLFSWIDYLCEEQILEVGIQKKIASLKQSYSNKEISHDQYAEFACAEYAKSLKGKKESVLKESLETYMRTDKSMIFPFSPAIFKTLAKYHIAPIIISGAPALIIRQYEGLFGLRDIYAFDAHCAGGVFNGDVKCNAGYNKKRTVHALIARYGRPPIMGFGDSTSDLPLLRASKYAICVYNERRSRLDVRNLHYLSNRATACEVEKKMEMLLRQREMMHS